PAQIYIKCIARNYSVVALVDRHNLPHSGSPELSDPFLISIVRLFSNITLHQAVFYLNKECIYKAITFSLTTINNIS
ncbi:hypothetical protein, partial [Lysinibacillus fusiformis]|uniref:hypothetical protein n=1 Tax=Lysinibacillus fusiformis TaxID=28031 RepID=UPI0020C0F1B2